MNELWECSTESTIQTFLLLHCREAKTENLKSLIGIPDGLGDSFVRRLVTGLMHILGEGPTYSLANFIAAKTSHKVNQEINIGQAIDQNIPLVSHIMWVTTCEFPVTEKEIFVVFKGEVRLRAPH